MLAYYWYEGRGRTLTSEYLQKVYLILDAIRYNRTDEALIRLLTPIRNDNLAEADQNLRDFTQKLAPILSHRYFPPAPGV
jgi:EpsI family protein